MVDRRITYVTAISMVFGVMHSCNIFDFIVSIRSFFHS